MFRYFFRLFCLLFNIFIKPGKLNINDTSVIKWRVWPRDIDMNFHLNNGSLMTLMDFGRYDYLIRIGLLKLIRQERWQPIVGNSIVRFRKPLPLFASFELHTGVLCWDEKYVYFEQKVVYKEKVAGVLYVMGLFRGHGQSIAPFEVLKKMGVNEETPPMPEMIKQWRTMEMTGKK